MTKRCNYDCGYCSSFIHDAVSPFVKLSHVDTLIEACRVWCGTDREIKWSITGGEPFVDPNFLLVLKRLHTQPFTHQINAITNGSLPLDTYIAATDYLAGLTFSLHFERSPDEIARTLDTIVSLRQQTNIMISVNIMFLPGTSDRVLDVIDTLKHNSVSYVVRLIRPIDQEAAQYQPYEGKSKQALLKSADQQRQLRTQFVVENTVRADSNIQEYYSADEIQLIQQLNTAPNWVNAGIWLQDLTYQEINTDQLVSASRINFKGWTCYAGVDSIYIDWDGTVYRGLCLNDGAMGHISNADFVQRTTQPTQCGMTRCSCNIDIAARKAVDSDHMALIT